MRAIRYFVTYRSGEHYGRVSIEADKPICSILDIQKIENWLKQKNVEMGMLPTVAEALIVTGWQRFETDETPVIVTTN